MNVGAGQYASKSDAITTENEINLLKKLSRGFIAQLITVANDSSHPSGDHRNRHTGRSQVGWKYFRDETVESGVGTANNSAECRTHNQVFNLVRHEVHDRGAETSGESSSDEKEFPSQFVHSEDCDDVLKICIKGMCSEEVWLKL